MTGKSTRRHHLIVSGLSRSVTKGWIELAKMRLPCALGRSGRRAIKREGDGATPVGRYRLLQVLYRPERVPRPQTGLPVRTIRPLDGWCDASSDRNYNRKVRLPYPASTEQMSRQDGLYDVVVVLDYNIVPRKRRAGSAIFMHVARPGYTPTEGCVALSLPHLQRVLARTRRGALISIG